MNRRYTISVDSIWTAFAHEVANAPVEYDRRAAYSLYRRAREANVDLLAELAPKVRSLLTGEQLRQLPAIVTSYLDRRYLAGIRSGTEGNTANGAFGRPPGVPVGEGEFVPFGGGGRRPPGA